MLLLLVGRDTLHIKLCFLNYSAPFNNDYMVAQVEVGLVGCSPFRGWGWQGGIPLWGTVWQLRGVLIWLAATSRWLTLLWGTSLGAELIFGVVAATKSSVLG